MDISGSELYNEGWFTVSKEHRWKFDAAGWLFWLIIFVVLTGPYIFATWKMVYKETSLRVPIVTGIVFAAIGAGLISWAVNAVLQRKQKRQRIERRKKARKQK